MIRPDGSLLPETEQRVFLDTMRECEAARDHFRMPHFDLVDYSDVPVPKVEVDTILEIDITPLGAPWFHSATETILHSARAILLFPELSSGGRIHTWHA